MVPIVPSVEGAVTGILLYENSEDSIQLSRSRSNIPSREKQTGYSLILAAISLQQVE